MPVNMSVYMSMHMSIHMSVHISMHAEAILCRGVVEPACNVADASVAVTEHALRSAAAGSSAFEGGEPFARAAGPGANAQLNSTQLSSCGCAHRYEVRGNSRSQAFLNVDFCLDLDGSSPSSAGRSRASKKLSNLSCRISGIFGCQKLYLIRF